MKQAEMEKVLRCADVSDTPCQFMARGPERSSDTRRLNTPPLRGVHRRGLPIGASFVVEGRAAALGTTHRRHTASTIMCDSITADPSTREYASACTGSILAS